MDCVVYPCFILCPSMSRNGSSIAKAVVFHFLCIKWDYSPQKKPTTCQCLHAQAEVDAREFGLLLSHTVETLTREGLVPVSRPYSSHSCSCRSQWLEYERGKLDTGLGEGATLPMSCLEGISHHSYLGREGKKPCLAFLPGMPPQHLAGSHSCWAGGYIQPGAFSNRWQT